MKRLIYFVMAFIGFVLAVGTAGAADTDGIGLVELLILSLLSGVLMLIACLGLNLEEKRDEHRRGGNGKRKEF